MAKTVSALIEKGTPYTISNHTEINEINYAHKDMVNDLKCGKEFSPYADKFKFKIFFKAFEKPNVELLEYLERLEEQGECLIPPRTKSKMIHKWPDGSRQSQHMIRYWDTSGRSFVYFKDMSYLLFIQMIATDRYSNFIELIAETDK